MRFHYRAVAADRALEAADLLPHGSQAYAATLCWATRFAKDVGDEERARSIYRRYVATGPLPALGEDLRQRRAPIPTSTARATTGRSASCRRRSAIPRLAAVAASSSPC